MNTVESILSGQPVDEKMDRRLIDVTLVDGEHYHVHVEAVPSEVYNALMNLFESLSKNKYMEYALMNAISEFGHEWMDRRRA